MTVSDALASPSLMRKKNNEAHISLKLITVAMVAAGLAITILFISTYVPSIANIVVNGFSKNALPVFSLTLFMATELLLAFSVYFLKNAKKEVREEIVPPKPKEVPTVKPSIFPPLTKSERPPIAKPEPTPPIFRTEPSTGALKKETIIAKFKSNQDLEDKEKFHLFKPFAETFKADFEMQLALKKALKELFDTENVDEIKDKELFKRYVGYFVTTRVISDVSKSQFMKLFAAILDREGLGSAIGSYVAFVNKELEGKPRENDDTLRTLLQSYRDLCKKNKEAAQKEDHSFMAEAIALAVMHSSFGQQWVETLIKDMHDLKLFTKEDAASACKRVEENVQIPNQRPAYQLLSLISKTE